MHSMVVAGAGKLALMELILGSSEGDGASLQAKFARAGFRAAADTERAGVGRPAFYD